MFMDTRILKILLLFTLGIFGYTENSVGQGCSDAGFCTMGALRPGQKYSRRIQFKLRSVQVSQYLGITRFKDYISVTTAEATIGINDLNSIHIKLPYQSTVGPLGNFGGLGDVSLSYTRVLLAKESGQVSASLGLKVPTHQPDNIHESGLSLPMYYQSTLGTVDLIAGASWVGKRWLVAAGVQHALTTTKSDFLWADWAGHPMEDLILTYPQANALKRGTDLMLRIEYNLRLGDKNFYTGLLPIYRVQNDIITGPDGSKIEVAESNGLALSWISGASYQFSVQSGINAMFGYALRQRVKNPDGLSRKFVFTLGYEYRF